MQFLLPHAGQTGLYKRMDFILIPRISDYGKGKKVCVKFNALYDIVKNIFPEINIDNITKILGMNITFVTSANTDEEGFALLKEFGIPFKK
mgnify:CR=1 FL=1